jgi:hypothetical protein
MKRKAARGDKTDSDFDITFGLTGSIDGRSGRRQGSIAACETMLKEKVDALRWVGA